MKFPCKLLSLLFALSVFSSCSNAAENQNRSQSSTSSTPISSQTSSETSSTTQNESSQSQAPSEEEFRTGAIPVMDASFYRGTITEMNEIDDTSVFTLLGAPGAGFGDAVKIAFSDNPQIELDPTQLQVGDQVEVYFTKQEDAAYHQVLSAIKLFEESATNYNGIVVEIIPGETDQEGRLVMKPLVSEEVVVEPIDQFIFNYGEQTRWLKDLSPQSIQPGDKLNIYHRGISTMSIPPQGIPLEIRVMAEDERLAVK